MNEHESRNPGESGPPTPREGGTPPASSGGTPPLTEPSATETGARRPDAPQEPEFQLLGGNRDWQIRIAVIAALLVAVVVWLIAQGGGDDGGEEQASTVDPVAVTVEELREYATDFGHPIYWLGERPGQTYEFSRTEEGNVFIRYLPPGVEVGAEGTQYLTIGTYPQADPFAATQQVAERPGAVRGRAPDGAIVVTNESRPTSVYYAQPGSPVQVEVYDPNAERAMRAATSGDLQPVQ